MRRYRPWCQHDPDVSLIYNIGKYCINIYVLEYTAVGTRECIDRNKHDEICVLPVEYRFVYIGGK